MSTGAKAKTFVDATALLVDGTNRLRSGELIHLQHFTLMDAMNAIEVMDPRMDSGVKLPDTNEAMFDPSAPLLPEEVCWILDRALACEMAYLTGLTLSQTAYTILHLLPDHYPHSELDALRARHASSPEDSTRPLELVGLVLRAGLMGMSKCVGVMWEELMKGNLYEGEDFSGDKFGLTLCDSIPEPEILAMLEEARRWLDTAEFEPRWKEALELRLSFRISFLQTLSSLIFPSVPASSDCPTLFTTISLVDELVTSLALTPMPVETSPARKAFDPNINRKLVSNIPLQAVEIGPIEDAVALLQQLMKGLQEVVEVGQTESLRELMEFVSLRSACLSTPPQLALIRSLTLSTIYSPASNLILHVYPLPWLVQTYFLETALVPPGLLHSVVELAQDDFPRPWGRQNEGGTGREGPTLGEAVGVFQQRVSGFLVSSMSNSCQNRPRGKRLAAKAISQWEELHDEAMDLIPLTIDRLALSGYPDSLTSTLHRIPSALHLHRLTLLRDLLFAGFDLTLYSPPEYAMLYWAAARLFHTEYRVLGNLIQHVDLEEEGDEARERVREWEGRRDVASGLKAVCRARLMSALADPKLRLEPEKERALFAVRFKFLRKTASSSHTASDDRFCPTYEEYSKEVLALRELEPDYLRLRATNFLAEATSPLRAARDDARLALREEGGDTALRRLDLEWKEAFLAVCETEEEQEGTEVVGEKKKGHRWFPVI